MVAVLFVRERSVYKTMTGLDCWDEARDARLYSGNEPVVAHPPCRAWGRYAYKAKVRPGEKDLAIFAVQKVRQNGGVLEHPSGSKLWAEIPLPRPGQPPDEFGGYTILVNQCDFGHRARKSTWLYIVGAKPPPRPPRSDYSVPIEKMGRAERERTPKDFALFLLFLARQAQPHYNVASLSNSGR